MKTLNSTTYEPKLNDATLFTSRNNMGVYSSMEEMDRFEYRALETERLMTFYHISEKSARRLADIRATYFDRFKKSPPPYYGIVC